ncbi:MAG: hypothetical protein ABIJ35_03170 [Acidobacteriota bacterium]
MPAKFTILFLTGETFCRTAPEQDRVLPQTIQKKPAETGPKPGANRLYPAPLFIRRGKSKTKNGY